MRRSVAGKARVHERAQELGGTSKQVLTQLESLGEFVKSASSTVEAPVARKLRDSMNGGGNGGASAPRPRPRARPAPPRPAWHRLRDSHRPPPRVQAAAPPARQPRQGGIPKPGSQRGGRDGTIER